MIHTKKDIKKTAQKTIDLSIDYIVCIFLNRNKTPHNTTLSTLDDIACVYLVNIELFNLYLRRLAIHMRFNMNKNDKFSKNASQ